MCRAGEEFLPGPPHGEGHLQEGHNTETYSQPRYHRGAAARFTRGAKHAVVMVRPQAGYTQRAVWARQPFLAIIVLPTNAACEAVHGIGTP